MTALQSTSANVGLRYVALHTRESAASADRATRQRSIDERHTLHETGFDFKGGVVTQRNLTEAQARAIIAPWYSLFNIADRGDVAAVHEQVVAPDYESVRAIFPGNVGAGILRSR